MSYQRTRHSGRTSYAARVECGLCPLREYPQPHSQVRAAMWAKGWRRDKHLGWLCPNCQRADLRQEKAARGIIVMTSDTQGRTE